MLFSVITPTHNRAAFLPETLTSVRQSVLAGLDASLEHLVFDVGSTDHSLALLRDAAGADDRLHPFHHPQKQLAGPARNFLIDKARGEWIVPLDDDDLLLQRCLFHYGQAIGQHPAARWFVADFLRVDEERRYLPGEDYYAWRFSSPTEMLQAIFRAEHFIQGNVCYQRALVREVGGYDEQLTMAEDLDLYVRFLLAGALPVVCPHLSHLHRFHRQNVSRGVDADKHHRDLTAIYRKYAAQLEQQGVAAP